METSEQGLEKRQWLIKQLLTNSLLDPYNGCKCNFVYYGEKQIGKTWAFVCYRNKYTPSFQLSAYEYLQDSMTMLFPKDVDEDLLRYWNGWMIEALTIRVLNEDGSLTPAAIAFWELLDEMSDGTYARNR